MKKPTRSIVCLPLLLLLGILPMAGCSDGGKPPVVSGGAAPAPANLSPEEKRQYDEAVKANRPPAGP